MKKVAIEMLNIALETRNNELIIDVLHEALQKVDIDSDSSTDETGSHLQATCGPDVFQVNIFKLQTYSKLTPNQLQTHSKLTLN